MEVFLKTLLALVVLLLTNFANATTSTTPELPPSACGSDECTAEMRRIVRMFEISPYTVSLTPSVYSGECYYLSSSYSPNQVQYSVVMIDKLENGRSYFSTIFGFFLPNNEFKSWSLEDARKEIPSDWKKIGNIKEGSRASRVEITDLEGSLANVYWMRQNPRNNKIYYITYMGAGQFKSFCELQKNK